MRVVSDDDDDKTVRGEDDLLKPPATDQVIQEGFSSIHSSNLPGSLRPRSFEPGENYLHNGTNGILLNCT